MSGSPIVSALPLGHPTENIFKFINVHLCLYVDDLPLYFKDTTNNALLPLKTFLWPSRRYFTITMDATSVYKSILHNKGIDASREV